MSSRLLITAMICYFPLLLSFIGILSEPVAEIEHFYEATLRMNWRLQVKIRAFENIGKITTVIVGSGTLAIVGTIVAEFIAATAGIGHSIRIALYQSDLAKILVALVFNRNMHVIVSGLPRMAGGGGPKKAAKHIGADSSWRIAHSFLDSIFFI